MTLEEFLLQTHTDVRAEIGNRLGTFRANTPTQS